MNEINVVTFFPSRLCPHPEKRRHFAGYGTAGNVDVIASQQGRNIEIIGQLSRKNEEVLCAINPTLPLLPPNEVSTDFLMAEPCLSEIRKKRASFLNMMKMIQYKRQQLKRTLTNAEDRKDITGHLKNLEYFHNERISLIQRGEDIEEDEFRLENDPMLRRLFIARYVPGFLKGGETLPESFRGIGDTNFIPACNAFFSGGAISHLNIPRQHLNLVIYPSGHRMTLLNIKSLVANEHVHKIGEEIFTANAYDRILEVDSVYARNNGFCVVRCKRKCIRYKYNTDESPPRWEQHMDMEFEGEDSPSSICLSSHLPGEAAIATIHGNVLLWHLDGTYTNVCNELALRFEEDSPWRQCQYGSHPRAVVVSDRTGCTLFDMRRKEGTSTYTVDLFALPHRCLHKSERVMITKRHPSNHFFHFIALQFSLVMVDERLPNHPVLFWTHQMLAPPAYISIAEDVLPGQHDVVIVGNQEKNEVFAFQISIKNKDRHPISTSTPWSISRTDDLLQFMRKQNAGIARNRVSIRLDVPIVGICAIPHTSGYGLSVFQISVHGDLYAQDYKSTESHLARDKTLSAGPGSTDVTLGQDELDFCKNWVAKVVEQIDKAKVANPELAGILDASTTIFSMRSNVYPHVLCDMCSSDLETRRSYRASLAGSAAGDDLCQVCGFYVSESQAFRDACLQDRVVPATGPCILPNDHRLNSLQMSGYDDAMSQIMLKLWEGETDDLTDLLKLLEQEREDEREGRIRRTKEKFGQLSKTDKTTPRNPTDEGETNQDAMDTASPSTDGRQQTLSSDTESAASDRVHSSGTPRSNTPGSNISMSRHDSTDSPSVHSNREVVIKDGEFILPLCSPKKSKRRSGSILSGSSRRSQLSDSPGFLVTPPRVRRVSGASLPSSPVVFFNSPANVTSQDTFLSYVNSQSPKKRTGTVEKPKKKKRKLVEGF